MPRTKHIAFFFAVMIAILFIALLFNAFKDSGSTFTLASTQRALAIESIAEYIPGVVVAVNTVREETRRSLIEKLRDFVPEERTVPTQDDVIETPPQSDVFASNEMGKPSYCADGSVSGSGVVTWGPVDIMRAEGARIITSKAIADDGTPLQSLQLTDHPIMGTTDSCVPKGMIGIALDGRVIEAGVPFMTSAEGIAGFALDGFAMFGQFEDGTQVASSQLDTCHGHVHPIVWDGTITTMYHYHVTNDAPYTLGCLRGTATSFE